MSDNSFCPIKVATDHLHEEMLMDILSRLPVRSLLQFKCISSIWKTLISNPYFTVKHLNRAKNDQGSQKLLITQMCYREQIFSMYCCPLSPAQLVDEDVQKLKLDCPSNPKPTAHRAILCLYDGLALIRVTDKFDRDLSTLLLWNPFTRESIVLPLQNIQISHQNLVLDVILYIFGYKNLYACNTNFNSSSSLRQEHF
ncbi:hypothetical protein CQW23_08864 [Capsicum baccatum]|uniref:F-box domain-containing protein n=1 Tax=Capsicum baccatum TaxID=33114 RepID=A0A2G2XA65_CAPBA|nr:hypothetical protein CQW23_08864 [Capsicum baccatum]